MQPSLTCYIYFFSFEASRNCVMQLGKDDQSARDTLLPTVIADDDDTRNNTVVKQNSLRRRVYDHSGSVGESLARDMKGENASNRSREEMV